MSLFPSRSRRRAVRIGLLAVSAVAASATQASAAGLPIVSVPAAPTYQSAGAYQLSANVNANGSTTVANIQYGATTSYGKTFTHESLTSAQTKSFTRITASMPVGSTVHYRVKATNASGTTLGPDQTYVVGGAPIVTAGGRPQGITGPSHHFLLRGTVNANALNTTTRIEYGPTTSYGSSLPGLTAHPGADSEVKVTVLNPAAGSTINYRTVATNAAGTTYGPNRVFKVPAGVVRPVYMYPTDRPLSQNYKDLIKGAVETAQEFFADEVEKTFTVASQPIVCPLPQNAAYYSTQTQLPNGNWSGTWQHLDAALSQCSGLVRDAYSNFVVYADVHTSCKDNIGGAVPGLTFMGDNDLKGLDGETNISNAPCENTTDQRTGPWGWTGGAAHEIGHTFGLPHPDGPGGHCEAPAVMTTECQQSLMYWGYMDIRTAYLLSTDIYTLQSHPFFT